MKYKKGTKFKGVNRDKISDWWSTIGVTYEITRVDDNTYYSNLDKKSELMIFEYQLDSSAKIVSSLPQWFKKYVDKENKI